MTLADVIAEIQAGIGFRADQVDNIKRKLTLAQQELERGKTLPSFLIVANESISLAVDENTWPLPSSFIREVDDFGGQYASFSDSDVLNLKKLPYDLAYSYYGGTTGAPMAYSRGATSLTFFPTPDEATTLSISYYAKQDDPATAATNAWSENAPLLLIGLAGMMVAQDLRDPEAKQDFATRYALGKESLFKETVAAEDANMQYSLGGLL